jgi:hypothetical protein
MRTTAYEHQTSSSVGGAGTGPPINQVDQLTQIWVGRQIYTRLSLPASPQASGSRWIEGVPFPMGSLGKFGVFGTVGPLGALTTTGPFRAVGVDRVGSSSLGGVPATKYAVPMSTCPASSKRPDGAGSTKSITLWVDGQGRLIKATSVAPFDLPNGPGPATSRSDQATLVESVRLYDFGVPLRITAPAKGRGIIASHGGSVSIHFSSNCASS